LGALCISFATVGAFLVSQTEVIKNTSKFEKVEAWYTGTTDKETTIQPGKSYLFTAKWTYEDYSDGDRTVNYTVTNNSNNAMEVSVQLSQRGREYGGSGNDIYGAGVNWIRIKGPKFVFKNATYEKDSNEITLNYGGSKSGYYSHETYTYSDTISGNFYPAYIDSSSMTETAQSKNHLNIKLNTVSRGGLGKSESTPSYYTVDKKKFFGFLKRVL
jgi:hypothetical protein